MTMGKLFNRAANAVAHAAGQPLTFLACCAIVVVWGASGPFFVCLNQKKMEIRADGVARPNQQSKVEKRTKASIGFQPFR